MTARGGATRRVRSRGGPIGYHRVVMPAPDPPTGSIRDAPDGDAEDPLFDARLLGRAARPVRPLLTSLERAAAVRPLLAAALVLPAVLATVDCRLDAVEPGWGLECLEIAAGRTPLPRDDLDGPPAAGATLTGLILRATGTGRPVGFFLLPWLAAVALAGTAWGAAAVCGGPRAAALAVLLAATHPALAAAAALTPPTLPGVTLAGGAVWAFAAAAAGGGGLVAAVGVTAAVAALAFCGPAVTLGPLFAAAAAAAHRRPFDRAPLLAAVVAVAAAGLLAWWWRGTPFAAVPADVATLPTPRPFDPARWLSLPLAAAGTAGFAALLVARRRDRTAARGAGPEAAPGGGMPAVPAASWAATAAGVGFTGHPPAVWSAAAAVATALAAAWVLERTCRRELGVRAALLLTAAPVVLWAAAPWVDGDAIGRFLRASLLAASAGAAWAAWRMLAHRWTETRRERRLLIAAFAGLVVCQLTAGIDAASARRSRGGAELASAVRAADASTLVLVAAPPRRDAARFLARAARPDLRVLVFAPGEPQVADLLARRSASGERTVLVAVGGGSWAWLTDRLEVPPDLFRSAGAVGDAEALLLRVGGRRMETARDALADAE